MSRPLPCATPSIWGMSRITTSASSLSAMLRAAVAPTLPAPITETLRFMLTLLQLSPENRRLRLRFPPNRPSRGLPRSATADPGYMFAMTASANSDVFSFVAPSMRRSRSYVTVFCWMVRSMPSSMLDATSRQPM